MATWELQGCQSPKRSNLPYRLLSSVSSSCHQHLVPPSFISLFYLLTDISYISFRCVFFLYDSSNVFLLFTHRRAIICHPVFTSPYVSLLHPSCLLPSFLFLFLSCLFLLSWLCIYVTFIIILYYRMRVCIILVIN